MIAHTCSGLSMSYITSSFPVRQFNNNSGMLVQNNTILVQVFLVNILSNEEHRSAQTKTSVCRQLSNGTNYQTPA